MPRFTILMHFNITLHWFIIAIKITTFFCPACALTDGMISKKAITDEAIKVTGPSVNSASESIRPSSSGWEIPTDKASTWTVEVDLTNKGRRPPIVVDEVRMYEHIGQELFY